MFFVQSHFELEIEKPAVSFTRKYTFCIPFSTLSTFPMSRWTPFVAVHKQKTHHCAHPLLLSKHSRTMYMIWYLAGNITEQVLAIKV